MTTTKPSIGFIGLGSWARPWPANVLAAGCELTVLEDLAEAVEG
jgi:3-hydroxyisobutyrate dehydrogenase-like beta-hydroxyacid dehydrogenase